MNPVHVLSLGAGVQSSAMALMAARGEITPMPEFAVFADTGDESEGTMRWLAVLKKLLPFPVHIAHRSVLSEHLYEWGHGQIPAYKINGNGKPTLGKRQCTKHWKIIPIYQRIRQVTGTVRKRLPDGYFVMWNGISVDEISRCKDSRVAWVKSRWPLVEKGMNRNECANWLYQHGYSIPPKSACVFCPFQRNSQWLARRSKPDEWEKVVRVDRLLAQHGEFLTSHCKRIDEIDFDVYKDQRELNLFENECEGMCGV